MTLAEVKAKLDTFSRVKIEFAVDSYDAKMTVRQVLQSACTVHAEWSRT